MRRRLIALLPVALLAACATADAPVAVVFFAGDSARLDNEAIAVVRRTAAEARSRTGPVTVLGFAGPVGGAAYNRALSEARAQHVADILIENGVAPGRIRIVPRGPVAFDAVPTESRRVEIRIAGG